MEADWDVEIGQGAPVIDALWPGFIDLRRQPERIREVSEAGAFPPLAHFLLALNAPDSLMWTAKCDLWEPVSEDANSALACYVDLLPFATRVFVHWQEAERHCRAWVARLSSGSESTTTAELVVREAIAGEDEGFGITAYLAASGADRSVVAAALAEAMLDFAHAVAADSKLQ